MILNLYLAYCDLKQTLDVLNQLFSPLLKKLHKRRLVILESSLESAIVLRPSLGYINLLFNLINNCVRLLDSSLIDQVNRVRLLLLYM